MSDIVLRLVDGREALRVPAGSDVHAALDAWLTDAFRHSAIPLMHAAVHLDDGEFEVRAFPPNRVDRRVLPPHRRDP